MSKTLFEALQAMVGEESEPKRANDEINRGMIRHWCEALHDDNPLYTDEEYSKTTEYGGVIMPPTMIQAHFLPRLWPEQALAPDPLRRAVDMCVDRGYPASVGSSMSYEFFEPVRPGDVVTSRIKLAGVSPEKRTRLGNGFFITAEYTYETCTGSLVCKQLLTAFQYDPLESADDGKAEGA